MPPPIKIVGIAHALAGNTDGHGHLFFNHRKELELLLFGLVTSVLFGFLLQKARVIRYDKQLGALRLMDPVAAAARSK